MKIEKIIIENVKSFKNKTEIYLNKNMNIFIGSNRGGKSNFLDIVIFILRHFFVSFYRVLPSRERGITIEDINEERIFHPINNFLEKYLGNEQNDSLVEVVFIISKEDIDNINVIKKNKEKFEQILNDYRNKPLSNLHILESWNLEGLSGGVKVTYQIINNNIASPPNDPDKTYFQYLQYYEFFAILGAKIRNFNLNPLFLYYPPYRMLTQENLTANLSNENFYQLLLNYSKANSKYTESLLKISANYFASKRRKFELERGDYDRKFKKDEEVKSVSKFLKILGYDWDLECIEPSLNEYRVNLARDSKELPISKASSGEREILNFLLGIFSYRIKNGLIIVDEPDLHLHPKWQNILVDLFNNLSVQNNNQFLIVTHSPSFINEKTIDSVSRVYLDKNISKVAQPDKDSLPRSKELLHLINTLNNEKIFFADKVVLVEGLSDRILFQMLIDNYKKNTQEVIEVLEVQGKDSLGKFRDFLDLFNIKNFIVADLDYAFNIGNEKIKNIFITNYKNIDKNVLKRKKSKDAKSLSECLEKIIINIKDGKLNSKEKEDVNKIWDYIKSRHRKIKDSISAEEKTELYEFIKSKKSKRIYILKYGEIEDYIPEISKSRNVESTIEFIKNKKLEAWVNQKEKDGKKEELESIILNILGQRRRKVKTLNPGKKINKAKASGTQNP